MFQILDRDGLVVTTYKNLSEAKTYWEHSVGNGPPEFDEKVRQGEIVVFDAAHNEVGAIRKPRQ